MCTVLAFLLEVVDIPDIPSNHMITTCLPSVHWQELYFSPFEKLAKKTLHPSPHVSPILLSVLVDFLLLSSLTKLALTLVAQAALFLWTRTAYISNAHTLT